VGSKRSDYYTFSNIRPVCKTPSPPLPSLVRFVFKVNYGMFNHITLFSQFMIGEAASTGYFLCLGSRNITNYDT